MNTVRFILLALAAILFLCAACDWKPGPVDEPIPAGLFCWVLAVLLGGVDSFWKRT